MTIMERRTFKKKITELKRKLAISERKLNAAMKTIKKGEGHIDKMLDFDCALKTANKRIALLKLALMHARREQPEGAIEIIERESHGKPQ